MSQNQYLNLSQARRKELGEQSARVRGDIVEDIKKEIEQKSKKENYSLVFDKAGMTSTGLPPLLYSLDTFDITNDILKSLNSKKPDAVKK